MGGFGVVLVQSRELSGYIELIALSLPRTSAAQVVKRNDVKLNKTKLMWAILQCTKMMENVI